MEKAAKPLKIFISYGHEIDVTDNSGKPLYPEPNNESVVRKIKAYLESRGHKVWLDSDKIKKGDNWREAIYKGVEDSNVALICLSRRAMRPNGVCRDEIAIAVGVRGGNLFPVKLESLEVGEYPAYLLTNQFTNFTDWQQHLINDNLDETWLNDNLEDLDKELELDKFQLYGVEMGELQTLLNPWNMNIRLRNLDRGVQYLFNGKEWERKTVHEFCGRESLFSLFEEKIAHGGQAVRIESDRVLWLKKGPGFGKSRFAAELLYKYFYAISAAYFIEYNKEETLSPNMFIRSVAYQLAQANPTYRTKLLKYLKENQDSINLQTDNPQTLFEKLLVNLLSNEIDGGRGTQWILVDALDEATVNNRNEIVSLISQNLKDLPPWLCFFITSRDEDNAVNRYFAPYTPIDFSEAENVSDVRNYIINEFKGMDIAVSEELVNILQQKSEGTFLYPEMVFRDLKKNSFTIDDIRDLPSGVIKYIHSQFDRLFGSDLKLYKREIRPMLGFILTSCEPISRAVLKYCLGISRDSELDDRLEMLGTFFIQSGSTDKDTVVPFHKSVIDYCFDKSHSVDYYVYPDEANEDFANRGLELYKSGALQWTTRADEEPDIDQRYFLTWLPSHLMNANMKKEAAAVLSDFAFLMKRLRFGNVERVLQDYILFRGKLERISKDCDAYFDVICSNAHFLRRNCEDNPAYKIMLQIATEVADKCPVTQAAERWLNPKENDSPCDWFWLNKVNRPEEYQPNPCKLVIEDAGDQAILLSNGDVLSWGTDDHNLRIFDLQTGDCKAVLEGHTRSINGAIELRSHDILSWSSDTTLRLWSPDGTCKAVLEGHTDEVNGAIELRSGDILSWCKDISNDYTMRLWTSEGASKKVMKRFAKGLPKNFSSKMLLSFDNMNKGKIEGYSEKICRVKELCSGNILSWSKYDYGYILLLWSPDGNCNAVLEGHTDEVNGAIELRSGEILSWSRDHTLRLWSPKGKCNAVLEGHTDEVNGALELRSGEILSWSSDHTMRLWYPNGTYKAVLEGNAWITGAIELNSGNILSGEEHGSLRLWTPDGKCIAILEGHTNEINGIIELHSGDILSWSGSFDHTLRIWTSDGVSKAVLEGHTNFIKGVKELSSGDILSWSDDHTLSIWSPEGTCKAVLEGNYWRITGAIELKSGDILSWGDDNALHLWYPDILYKTVQEGHTDYIEEIIELCSGTILSWSSHDSVLRLWSPDGTCKAVLEGHTGSVYGAIELRSGDILSWSSDTTLRLWSPDGTCKAVLEGHTFSVNGAKELRSGDILSWSSYDKTLRLWSPKGKCNAVLEGHTFSVNGAKELRSGDILSWSSDYTLRLWSPKGKCKAVLEGHTSSIDDVIELRSGDILSWSSYDKTLRLWSPEGTCKAVLEGHTDYVSGAIELISGDILSRSWKRICLWSSDGVCKEVIRNDNPKFNSYYSLFFPKQVRDHFFAEESSWGIELQHNFKLIARWNNEWHQSRFVGAGRLCVWHGRFVDFLQLNYGNHMSVSFEQAHQLLAGEIDESKLVTYVPQPKGTDFSKTE